MTSGKTFQVDEDEGPVYLILYSRRVPFAQALCKFFTGRNMRIHEQQFWNEQVVKLYGLMMTNGIDVTVIDERRAAASTSEFDASA